MASSSSKLGSPLPSPSRSLSLELLRKHLGGSRDGSRDGRGPGAQPLAAPSLGGSSDGDNESLVWAGEEAGTERRLQGSAPPPGRLQGSATPLGQPQGSATPLGRLQGGATLLGQPQGSATPLSQPQGSGVAAAAATSATTIAAAGGMGGGVGGREACDSGRAARGETPASPRLGPRGSRELFSPLMAAAAHRRPAVVELLLGCIARHAAERAAGPRCAGGLGEEGWQLAPFGEAGGGEDWSVDAQNPRGVTALMYASAAGSERIVLQLLAAGADRTLRYPPPSIIIMTYYFLLGAHSLFSSTPQLVTTPKPNRPGPHWPTYPAGRDRRGRSALDWANRRIAALQKPKRPSQPPPPQVSPRAGPGEVRQADSLLPPVGQAPEGTGDGGEGTQSDEDNDEDEAAAEAETALALGFIVDILRSDPTAGHGPLWLKPGAPPPAGRGHGALQWAAAVGDTGAVVALVKQGVDVNLASPQLRAETALVAAALGPAALAPPPVGPAAGPRPGVRAPAHAPAQAHALDTAVASPGGISPPTLRPGKGEKASGRPASKAQPPDG